MACGHYALLFLKEWAPGHTMEEFLEGFASAIWWGMTSAWAIKSVVGSFKIWTRVPLLKRVNRTELLIFIKNIS